MEAGFLRAFRGELGFYGQEGRERRRNVLDARAGSTCENLIVCRSARGPEQSEFFRAFPLAGHDKSLWKTGTLRETILPGAHHLTPVGLTHCCQNTPRPFRGGGGEPLHEIPLSAPPLTEAEIEAWLTCLRTSCD